MAMFSEDIGLLPSHLFTSALDDALASTRPTDEAYDLVFGLFREMNERGRTGGGRYKGTPYFNGGLFSGVEAIALTQDELINLREAAATNWAAVRPEIFGTLFEQSMDADERHAYGAHFTSQADIAKIVIPTIVTPWRERIAEARTRGKGGINALERLLLDMSAFRVLDPACGSGNFLYVAYREMRRLEHEVLSAIAEMRRSSDIAAQASLAYVTADHFYGMDVNKFAVEVAKVTMMLGKKLAADELEDEQQVLPLDNLDRTIVASDALFDPWPKADVIIGNPPYLGRRKMVEELGLDYVQRLAEKHPTIGGVSDFVCYWFPLTHDALGDAGRAGLVATQSIRDASSRKVSLDYITDNDGVIFDAVSSQPWSGDAVVHVSIVNWIKGSAHAPDSRMLWLDNGQLRLSVDHIPASLRPTTDVATAKPLQANKKPKACWQGQTTGIVSGYRLTSQEASAIIAADPASRQVIHPVLSGDPLLHKLTTDTYVIDIPFNDALEARTRAPGAMGHLREHVLPLREKAAEKEAKRNAEMLANNPTGKSVTVYADFLDRHWWKHWRRRDDLITAISKLPRYIALTIVAGEGRKSVYQFVDSAIRPDASLQVFAFDDDYSFGILSSQLHRDWFDGRCSRLKVDPRYTPTTVFDSFPWPANPSPSAIARVAAIVKEILEVREAYLEQGITLAKQYDSLREPGRSRLGDLHRELDDAVFDEVYAFSRDDDSLAQLLALNLAGAHDPEAVARPGGSGLPGSRTSNYKLKAPLV